MSEIPNSPGSEPPTSDREILGSGTKSSSVSRKTAADTRLDQILGNLLRFGVLLAAAVIAIGGIRFLRTDGKEKPNYAHFHGEPLYLRDVPGIIADAKTGDARGVIALGLLLLVATPIARVILSAIAFAIQRDWLYVGATLIVLAALMYGMFGIL